LSFPPLLAIFAFALAFLIALQLPAQESVSSSAADGTPAAGAEGVISNLLWPTPRRRLIRVMDLAFLIHPSVDLRIGQRWRHEHN